MKTTLVSRLAVVGVVSLGLTVPQLAWAGLSPAGLASGSQAVTPLVTQVKKWKNKNWNGRHWKPNKRIYVGPRGGRVYVRGWNRRPYYGTVIAGVALGTIIAATVAPRPPANNLCWYWTNPARTHGYWDYCY
jgi:hypothetical protein